MKRFSTDYWLADSYKTDIYIVFTRLMGLIYLIAIFPLLFQIKALVGSNGLQPAKTLLHTALKTEGLHAIIRFPSVYWLMQTDDMLHAIIVVGCIAAVGLVVNYKPLLSAIVAWACFTSISVIGGDFLVIIIDLFLSEVGVLLILVQLSLFWYGYVARIVHFSLIYLNFRLWFSMGMVKFYFPGTTWTDFSFFHNFFPNQSIPTPLAFLFWKLPLWTNVLAEGWLFVSQIIIPFFVFGNRKFKLIAFASFVFTSVLIMLTGNYGYFNVLSIVTAVILLAKQKEMKGMASRQISAAKRIVVLIGGSVLLFMQGVYTIALFDPNPPCYQNHFNQVFLYSKFQKLPAAALAKPFEPLVYARVCNPYGVFKSMPNFRIELRFYGSNDSANWQAYKFKYAPSANTQNLRWAAPYYPRLDHLMFYETLDAGGYNFNLWNPYYTRNNVWTGKFIEQLYKGDDDLLKLLAENPFKTLAPKYIKCEAYSLKFNNEGSMYNAWNEKYLMTPYAGTIHNISHRPLMNSDYIYNKVEF